ncbi:connector enhancer of kinase suppressor of ras 1 isoform X2 [Crotalus tigris]|uniref:connector enhancer of kinase suppressor of ras 1 isoform X2 n=1 Tax=Crotalus tigris TaxID=88082 RepID=UPI00192F6402|nr:connector enhancer of kinase suppressor of ras 1 isoform X2 [Crotalus tigris]
MEPVSLWTSQTVLAWIRGLDPALQGYPVETWGLTGKGLLRLSYWDLENLGVSCIGHQELLLEAVEQLCVLNYELATSNLRTLTEKLQGIVRTTEVCILSRRKVSTYHGAATGKSSLDLLASVVELIGAAKSLFLWLNRYLFSHLHDYSASRDIIWLCGDLAKTVQKECTVSEREDRILLIGRHISGICEHILHCSPANLLDQTAILETVELEPAGPEDNLGLEIKSLPSCLHLISGTAREIPVDQYSKVFPGDEIVQVNDQVVVGWTQMNLVKKLLESSRVTLVLKKIPLVSSESPRSPESPSHQQPNAFLEVLSSRSDDSSASSASPTSSMTAEFEETQNSVLDLPTVQEEHKRIDCIRHPVDNICGLEEVLSGAEALPDPALERQDFGADAMGPKSPDATVPSTPRKQDHQLGDSSRHENGFVRGQQRLTSVDSKEGSAEIRRKQKGATTRLSRRRISCQELGQVDCDGWLLKKKDHVGFMAQKWKRFWFVLKGHNLYWYSNPNDEKAVGLINVSAYRLESTKEQKKKYVFQLTHEKYKPFIFAAETLADLSMWVSRLITSMTKYTASHKSGPPNQEDCYSETEAEDPEDDSPRHSFDQTKQKELEKAQLPSGATGRSQNLPGSPLFQDSVDEKTASPSSPGELIFGTFPSFTGKNVADPAEEELESLIQCLKQGGVSLIGKQQVFTREYYRKSFVKRNKNPEINEKVHLVRTLQSTLKAKTAELQLLDILLEDTELNSEKFRSWKEQHQELYQEIQMWWAKKLNQDNGAIDSGFDLSLEAASDPLHL